MKFLILFLMLLVPNFSFAMKEGVAIRGPVGTPVLRNVATGQSPVTTSYSQLVASMTYAASAILVMNTGDVGITIGKGANAAEVDQVTIPPGGHAIIIPVEWAKGSRLAVKGTATSTTGFFAVTFFQ